MYSGAIEARLEIRDEAGPPGPWGHLMVPRCWSHFDRGARQRQHGLGPMAGRSPWSCARDVTPEGEVRVVAYDDHGNELGSLWTRPNARRPGI